MAIPYFDAHCDTIWRCMVTEPVADYGETEAERRAYFQAGGSLRPELDADQFQELDVVQVRHPIDPIDQLIDHLGKGLDQRQFRAVYGTTVFDHLRDCRLQRARHALEHDGLTVGQAAVLAGYTSAANFATAYRRRFGMPPKLARARI